MFTISLLRDRYCRPSVFYIATISLYSPHLFLLLCECRDPTCSRSVFVRSTDVGVATLRTLTFGRLPPVGQLVDWRSKKIDLPKFPGHEIQWTASGTAALAGAIKLARARRPEIQAPEVLIPAYGCPDLVAAVVYSGAIPIQIDIGETDPGFSLEELDERWTDNVIAVVAVNFLGIRERLDELMTRAASRNAMLIEDCAQWFPEDELIADATILSFGRGKPVNLLGGGALILPEGSSLANLVQFDQPRRTGIWTLQAVMFNFFLKRFPFAIAARILGAKLGETHYRELAGLCSMDKTRVKMIGVNAIRWLNRDRHLVRIIEDSLKELNHTSALSISFRERTGRLLRFPVLTKTKILRDQALNALNECGLGATSLYGLPLDEVAGVPTELKETRIKPGAKAFADCLLTLPIHEGVRLADIQRMTSILVNLAT